MNWQTITMKFPGTCLICHEKILTNETALWAKGVGIKHENCLHKESFGPFNQPVPEIPNTYLVNFEINGVLHVIEDRKIIEDCQQTLVNLITKNATKKGNIRIGLPLKSRQKGTTTEWEDFEVFWIKEHNFWWGYKKLENAANPRYRNLFGIDEPYWLELDKRKRNHQVCEINPSLFGSEKVNGAFVEDDSNNVYLATKRVGGVYGKGKNIKDIETFFSKNSTIHKVKDKQNTRDLFIIAKLNNLEFFSQISFFATNLQKLKKIFEESNEPLDNTKKQFVRSQNTLDGLQDVGVSKIHIQILKQFLILEGQIITDSTKIRGEKGVSMIPPNSIVSEPHYLHNLVRGVYKPQGDDFALSIQTNPQSKWGTEIDFETGNWKINYDFGDEKQYANDITSLQKCFVNNVPLGVIYKLKKGENKILGLGKITKIEGSKFEIIPFAIDEKIENINNLALNYAKDQILQKDFSAQGSETTTFVRAKQQVFRAILLEEYDGKCAFCGFGIEEYLNAAHIVPFKIMQKEDQMNAMHPSNGLLLCRLCDIAFENGDIIVQKDEVKPTENLIKKTQDNQSAKRWLSQLKRKLEIKNDAKYPPDEKYFTRKMELLQNNQS